MTSLYKRYIPPKTVAPSSAPSIFATQPIVAPKPPKRKRERSEEEVAERKAKKAKKKGVTVESVVKIGRGEDQSAAVKAVKPRSPTQPVPKVEPELALVDQPEVLEAGTVPLPDVEAVEEAAATGDFSHVKNKKKRHKLEKEARKARKAAEKGGGGSGDGDGRVEVEMEMEATENTGNVEIQREVQGEVQREKVLPNCDGVAATEAVERHVASAMKNDEVTMEESEEEVVQAAVKITKAGKTDDEAVDTTAEDPSPEALGPKYDEAASQPTKRRHKLEAVLEGALDDNEASDAHLRKHGAILSNFQKASKRAQALQSQQPKANLEAEKESLLPTVEDLEMPDADLPSQNDEDDGEEGISSNLPSWLAKPTIISADSKASLVSLHLPPKTLTHLSALNFENALPVQQALIPLLLPPGTPGSAYLTGTDLVLPDLAVSAATGSGKTLAYLLPIIESLKLHSTRGRLTALIVVPTRELVMQVAAVAESLAKSSGLKVGMATGGGKFAEEQKRVVTRGFQYAPKSEGADAEEEYDLTGGIDEDLLDCPHYHKVTHDSALDILVATPGRLLEHLEHTKGFNLVHLKWFVLDEADKLLDHQSAAEISSLLRHVSRSRKIEEQDARERFLKQQGEWDDRAERRVRKVLLSATMTRDVQRFTGLGLRFPTLIAVQQEVEESKSGFEVPEGLKEYVVPVGDGSEKPLVALEWLRTRVFGENESGEEVIDRSDSESDPDSDSESGTDSESSVTSVADHESDHKPPPAKRTSPTVLVFTATSESASRLSHLLRTLKPNWEKSILLLTKAQKSLPRSMSSSGPLIVVSTDRAARGLDSLAGRPISHVLQYDVPTSLTNYVHRVGRTARNGREGEGWTLFARREAAWFLKVVGVEQGGEGEGVKRKGLVERVKVFMEDDHVRERYAEVLGDMRGEVLGSGKSG